MKNDHSLQHNQTGVVLVTGLIFLIMLCLLGTISISATIMSEKTTQNLRDQNTAFASAESALSDGETWLKAQGTPVTGVSNCNTPPCPVWSANTLGNFYANSDTWWQSNGVSFSGTMNGVASQPRYLIEQLYYVPTELSPDTESKGQGYYFYRVTSYGTGATNSARTVVQSTYAVQY